MNNETGPGAAALVETAHAANAAEKSHEGSPDDAKRARQMFLSDLGWMPQIYSEK